MKRGRRSAIALQPCDLDRCHSEEPFDYAQDKLRDEESRFGTVGERFFAFVTLQLRMTAS